ncbi:MAG: AI-2E family transporter [Bacillota bacterium]|nr:AI-2E family transporter [Bacillota bacterium]
MRKLISYFKDRRLRSALLLLCAAISFYMLLAHLPQLWQFVLGTLSVIKPLITAGIIAYLLYPGISFFERKLFGRMKQRKRAHSLSTILLLLCLLGLFSLLSLTVIPQLVSSAMMLLDSLEYYFDSFRDTVSTLAGQIPGLELNVDEMLRSWEDIFQTAVQWLLDNAGQLLGGAVRIGNGVVNFIIAMILAVYMLLDIQRLQLSLKRFCRSWLQEGSYKRAIVLAKNSDLVFRSFIRDNLLDSLIVGVANFLFMFIMGMPYPLLISVIVGVTNFIPNFGPFIGAIPSLLIILLINPIDALWFLIWTLVMQFLDGNVLKPLLFNGSTGLSPLWVLAGIIIGGRLFGITGMIIGIPLLSIFSQILREHISKRLEKRGFDSKGDPIP